MVAWPTQYVFFPVRAVYLPIRDVASVTTRSSRKRSYDDECSSPTERFCSGEKHFRNSLKTPPIRGLAAPPTQRAARVGREPNKNTAVDCQTTVRSCVIRARNCVSFRRRSRFMKVFSAFTPLDFAAIDILGDLVTTSRNTKSLSVIPDCFLEIVHTVLLWAVTAKRMATAYVTHWVMVYGPPRLQLSDNGKQFTSWRFRHVCEILRIKNLFTFTY